MAWFFFSQEPVTKKAFCFSSTYVHHTVQNSQCCDIPYDLQGLCSGTLDLLYPEIHHLCLAVKQLVWRTIIQYGDTAGLKTRSHEMT